MAIAVPMTTEIIICDQFRSRKVNTKTTTRLFVKIIGAIPCDMKANQFTPGIDPLLAIHWMHDQAHCLSLRNSHKTWSVALYWWRKSQWQTLRFHRNPTHRTIHQDMLKLYLKQRCDRLRI